MNKKFIGLIAFLVLVCVVGTIMLYYVSKNQDENASTFPSWYDNSTSMSDEQVIDLNNLDEFKIEVSTEDVVEGELSKVFNEGEKILVEDEVTGQWVKKTFVKTDDAGNVICREGETITYHTKARKVE